MLRTQLYLGISLAALWSAAALADAAPAASTAPAEQSWIMKNGKASYTLEMLGMRTEALSGNLDGAGTNLNFNHYLAVGAKTGGSTSVKLTQPISQYIDEKSEAVKRHIQPGNPYLIFSPGSLLKNEAWAFDLGGYLRYYIPISKNTVDAKNRGFGTSGFAPVDNGRGALRIALLPSKSWFDGKLTFAPTALFTMYFNALTPQERFDRQVTENLLQTRKGGSTTPLKSYRQDAAFIFDPTLAYTLSPKWEVYIEWTTNALRHSTEGKWTSINDPTGNGHYFSYGVNWAPTKKVSVSGSLTYNIAVPAVERGLDKQDVGVTVGYSFL